MNLAEFLKAPWSNSHPSYTESMIALQPAPEFGTAEILIASLYRASGYASCAEGDVSGNGKALDQASRALKPKVKAPGSVGPDTWRTILHSVIESPKQPQQSDKRFLQLSPVVPDISLYSGAARLTGSPWNPGELIKRLIWMGAPSSVHAQQLWQSLHEGLSVTQGDDAWALWLHEEFGRRAPKDFVWQAPSPLKLEMLEEGERSQFHLPARQFVRDLEAVLGAKSSMTRRQWVSVLESVVRLGTVSHVLWVCRANHRLWQLVEGALDPSLPPLPKDEATLRRDVLHNDRHFFAYGRPAQATIRDCASEYLVARQGINMALWMLGAQSGNPEAPRPELRSAQGMLAFLHSLRAQAPAFRDDGFAGRSGQLRDEHARTINCKSGIGKNIGEFCRYVLARREPHRAELRGYDQGYVLRKRSEAKSAQFVISLGPVSVLSLVHCCLWGVNGPRSVQRLAHHLAVYGISVGIDDIAQGDLGQKLRMLGLVLDSPDAESGILLVPPFTRAHPEVSS